jgi:hypothetical protein
VRLRDEAIKLGKEREALQKKTVAQLHEARKEADGLREFAASQSADATSAVRQHAEAMTAADSAVEAAHANAQKDKADALAKLEAELMSTFKELLSQGEMQAERANAGPPPSPSLPPPPPSPIHAVARPPGWLVSC